MDPLGPTNQKAIYNPPWGRGIKNTVDDFSGCKCKLHHLIKSPHFKTPAVYKIRFGQPKRGLYNLSPNIKPEGQRFAILREITNVPFHILIPMIYLSGKGVFPKKNQIQLSSCNITLSPRAGKLPTHSPCGPPHPPGQGIDPPPPTFHKVSGNPIQPGFWGCWVNNSAGGGYSNRDHSGSVFGQNFKIPKGFYIWSELSSVQILL